MTNPVAPFKGIRERPYAQSILPSGLDRINKPVGWVAYKELWLTQKTLNIAGILGQRFSHDWYPHIVVWDGEIYLEDGHHRAVMRALNVGDDMPCRIIYDNNDETPSE